MSLHHAECLPALLSIFVTILFGSGERIGEGSKSGLKANAVFAQIAKRFVRVPHKAR